MTRYINRLTDIRPNTFLIGAPKCGTTSLTRCLGEHPDVFMSDPKEPGYFCRPSFYVDGIRSADRYAALFAQVGGERIVAEATTSIIFDPIALPRVREFAPDARIVVMLRNPMRMVLSWHSHRVRSFDEDIADFPSAWRSMADRRVGRRLPAKCRDPLLLDYQYIASLGTQLERVYNFFPANRIYVCFLGDFIEDPRRAWLDMLAFLELPDDGRTEFPVENGSFIPRNLKIYRLYWTMEQVTGRVKRSLGIKRGTGALEALIRIMPKRKEDRELDLSLSDELHAAFDPEIVKLERLTGRNLSHWKQDMEVPIDAELELSLN